MGMASKNAITSAAALQWVIKDGVGQFGGIITAGLLGKEKPSLMYDSLSCFGIGTRFDLEPKKLRFLAVLAMYVASFIEISTLAQPSYFLLFASVANLVKNIAWIILSATRASQLVQMSKTGNLGDLTAKMGSQGTASSLLGTIIGVSISSYLTLSSFPSFMSIYVPLACLGLFSLYRSTSFMVTNTLNRERLNILLDYFWCNYSRHMASAENPWFIICQDECDVADEFILTIDQVSVEESFVSPIVRWNYLPHVAINSTLKSPHNFEVFSQTLEHADDVSSGSPTGSRPVAVKNDRYLLNVDPIRRKPIYVWLTECSTSVDHIEAYFLCYILPKFHYDMEKFKALQGLFRSWRKAMERNGWNMDKFYYPEMEKRVVRLSSSFKSE